MFCEVHCFLFIFVNSDSFYTQRFFYLLYVFKGAKLAKFIRYEALWKLLFKIGLFFYHKVHGDGVK